MKKWIIPLCILAVLVIYLGGQGWRQMWQNLHGEAAPLPTLMPAPTVTPTLEPTVSPSPTPQPGVMTTPEPGPDAVEVADGFTYEPVPEHIKTKMIGKSYSEDCDVPWDSLRYVRVRHIGFDGQSHTGELIVNEAIAKDVAEVFYQLFLAAYPIEKIQLIDVYNANDDASCADNNSSAFNYRVVEGTDQLSQHAYGLAIDINPLYNPYVVNGEATVEASAPYVDRSLDCEYYIDEEDLCYQLFTERGFTWGGSWSSVKDYQHFQYPLR